MAGHSKWANIKHRKQTVDAKRGQIFQKLTKELQNAAKLGLDPKTNPVLRRALEKAKAVNMPKINITKILQKNFHNDSNAFWIANRFGKNVFILLKISDEREILIKNQIKDITPKNKWEILPFHAIKHLFHAVIHCQIVKVSDSLWQDILTNFMPADYRFNDQTQKLSLYFTDFQEAKKFRDYCQKNDWTLHKFQQTFLAYNKVELHLDLRKQLSQIYNKIANDFNCLQIVDNLS